ncbi:right-handed parallel beta-helix repeat-containing protein [bacterium]|nr:right-handed parallel beta-helix repeat-containing protein [bacterium]MBU1651492.1 right-handed parallel beta-helix repeat-containing protein [bacterium]MBU1882443.1 right-handed parallel beta-helix repeat-containing protein [bacterium]
MKKLTISSVIAFSIFCLTSLGVAETYIGGQVSGTWTAAASPYYVIADIEIPFGSSLVIEPGVQVKFTDHLQFIAHGNLTAVGVPGDSIIFTHSLPYETETWAGLNLLQTEGTPELGYCKIEWGYAQAPVTEPQSKGGAIHVYNTTASIHNCLITNCKADDDGGAIYLYQADAEVFENRIVNNVAYNDGGAIYLNESNNSYIHDNWIEDNSADIGGGIMYYFSGGVCENNDIKHNNATASNGGGMLLDNSSPTIQGNRIIANQSAQSSGSGIYMHHFSSPSILYNDVSLSRYTAIFCGDNSNPEITNNTIFGNGGYGIRTYQNSHPFGKNNIIWSNTYGLYISAGCSVAMTYSDVQGGWVGAGNFNDNPDMVNAWGEDFSLLPFSPCIDAGDPNPPYDPDGSIKDVGAHYFDQNTPQGICTIDLTPFGTPIILPPSGGTVWFGLSIVNSPDYYNIYDGWYTLTQPDGQIIPMVLREDLYMAPGGSLSRQLFLTLGSTAMSGIYTVTASVGDHPTIIESYDSFTFEKLAAADYAGGEATGTFFDGEVEETFSLKQAVLIPETTELLGHYPNPFNPQATISFNLATTERVTLDVYSISGQKIATLVDRNLEPGSYKEIFDGSGLASGMYLYVLQAGDFSAVGKMSLLK